MTGSTRGHAALGAAAVGLLLTLGLGGRAGSSETPAPFVRVLGTVQDGGLPHAACEHEACRRARQGLEPPRWITSLAIVLPESGQTFLIDTTPDIRPQLDLLSDVRRPPQDRVDRSPVSGVFLTHAHIGHYLGLAFFGFEAVDTRELPLWTMPRMASFLRANGPWSQLVSQGNVELRALAAETPVELAAGVSVTPFLVPHRDEFSETVGFVVRGPARTLLFVPDTDRWSTWEPPLAARLEGVDVALLDGTFFAADELPGRRVEEIGHPLIRTTLDLLESRVAAGDLEALFIHLNHSNPALRPESAAGREIAARGFAVAREGQTFPLG